MTVDGPALVAVPLPFEAAALAFALVLAEVSAIASYRGEKEERYTHLLFLGMTTGLEGCEALLRGLRE